MDIRAMLEQVQAGEMPIAQAEQMLKDLPYEDLGLDVYKRQGLIRPTFYNHFQDKYDLVEWIFSEDIVSEVDRLLQHGMQPVSYTHLIRLARDSKE